MGNVIIKSENFHNIVEDYYAGFNCLCGNATLSSTDNYCYHCGIKLSFTENAKKINTMNYPTTEEV